MKVKSAREGFEPLYKRGDKFIIVKLNSDPNLTPIEAKHLRSGRIYGFNEGELI